MSDTASPPPAGTGGGWEQGVASRLTNLAGARVVAQLLGLGWFFYIARAFDAAEFGTLSTGLALVIVVGGISDLGTTRTVVRHVAADRRTLRPTFLRAAQLRAAAGGAVGLIVVAVMAVADGRVPVAVVAAAAVVAVASGVTEVGFAALRSVGLVGAEVALLVGERLAFLAAAGALVVAGGGPVAVLVAYAATNVVSAIVIGWQVVRHSRGETALAGPMLDREGRQTALSSSLVIVGSRVSVVLLLVLDAPTVLGAFTLAQKVPEALGTLGTAALMPVLPMLREALVRRRWDGAWRRAGRVAATVAAAIAPPVAFLAVDGRRAIDLLFDAGDRAGVAVALALLSIVALLWVIRTLGEMALLAEERAGVYTKALLMGVAANVVVGVPLVLRWGAAGAAGAALVAEVVILVVVVRALRPSARSFARTFVPVAAAFVGGLAVAVAGRRLPTVAAGAAAAVVALVALVGTGRSLVGDRGSLGAPGDDPDVGAQLRGDLGGDDVETVEHGSGPAQHL